MGEQAADNTFRQILVTVDGREYIAPPTVIAELVRLRREVESWRTWGVIEVMVRNPNVNSYVKEMEADLLACREQLAASEKHIQDAGGYHQRTIREVEIEEALSQTPASERDSADATIAELLALVDAGRNRVHLEINRTELAEARYTALHRAASAVYDHIHSTGTEGISWGSLQEFATKSSHLWAELSALLTATPATGKESP